ncbi:MAG: Rrf2 family transcriptional regulator, cysteine metabolism repressor [Eubacteriales bacterium]|nr:Rrf2 family transcriptional regulator, cysteine metabolism repressor [Eubacteriales bacterium]MDN5363145.1 Rrf2 family transcriptional regulator, cysteine metabolism repressor [Eubacteriales bacterium]
MKISTRGHYGVMAMLDLALHHGEGPIPLKSVAERQNLSEHYLEQLIAVLRKAGLVKSVRGAQGGYTLAREPHEIKIGEIIRVLEGPIAPVECVNEEDPECCLRADYCVTRNLWEKVKASIEEVLDNTTLEDLVREAEKARQAGGYMYYI